MSDYNKKSKFGSIHSKCFEIEHSKEKTAKTLRGELYVE
jgi:hypothetical protein